MYHLLKNIKEGSIISGKVIKLKNRFNNLYVIEIFDQWITAKAPTPLEIGSYIDFIVEIKNGKHTLKIREKEKIISVNKEVKILRSCSLEVNSQNLKLISKYIEMKKPIQKDSILKFFRESNGI
ncbi:MAG: hypothetical protein CR982_03740 [Candidatus Cloacimonadota bacterium]|nr:MAG: hypothetical protein CR982_03740 [Candidatus Cloacimonadota bacterium]